MAEMSLKEKAVLGGVAVVGLYALTAVLWFTSFRKTFKSARNEYTRALSSSAEEKQLIGERDYWDEAYKEALHAIPRVPDETRADTYMVAVVRRIAQSHNISFEKESASPEKVAGEMNRLTIEFEWTGAFETLVGFLYELETTDKGKFDVSAININPMSKKQPGFLSGKMTLTCIFRR